MFKQVKTIGDVVDKVILNEDGFSKLAEGLPTELLALGAIEAGRSVIYHSLADESNRIVTEVAGELGLETNSTKLFSIIRDPKTAEEYGVGEQARKIRFLLSIIINTEEVTKAA